MNHSKMLGKFTRLCDSRHCSCNSATRGRGAKRTAKRRERQTVRKFLSTF